MAFIHIKLLSNDAYEYFVHNVESLTNLIVSNDDNAWMKDTFPQPMFVEKKIAIEDFELIDNPEGKDKEIDFENSKRLYEHLNQLPRHILTDVRFWLWLHLDKFYLVTKNLMKINSSTTIKNMWLHTTGVRRGLMFGVLSRCYFRIALTVDESKPDKYELSKWVVENPLRFRNLTWRSFSSEEHLVRGALRGEKRFYDENPNDENNDLYVEIAKYISYLGSVRLLDAISEEDLAEMVYNQLKKLTSE